MNQVQGEKRFRAHGVAITRSYPPQKFGSAHLRPPKVGHLSMPIVDLYGGIPISIRWKKNAFFPIFMFGQFYWGPPNKPLHVYTIRQDGSPCSFSGSFRGTSWGGLRSVPKTCSFEVGRGGNGSCGLCLCWIGSQMNHKLDLLMIYIWYYFFRLFTTYTEYIYIYTWWIPNMFPCKEYLPLFTYICHTFKPHVDKHSIHWAYGNVMRVFCCCCFPFCFFVHIVCPLCGKAWKFFNGQTLASPFIFDAKLAW